LSPDGFKPALPIKRRNLPYPHDVTRFNIAKVDIASLFSPIYKAALCT
jgi:hypothetical protein